MSVMLYNRSEVHFRLLCTNGFQVEPKKERFDVACLRYQQNLQYENFTSLLADCIKNCTKKRTARAARSFFLIQPIKSFCCRVVIVHTNANTLFEPAPTLSVARGNFSEKNRKRGSKSGRSPCTRTVIM